MDRSTTQIPTDTVYHAHAQNEEITINVSDKPSNCKKCCSKKLEICRVILWTCYALSRGIHLVIFGAMSIAYIVIGIFVLIVHTPMFTLVPHSCCT